jgi:hypothetical protein
MRGKMTDGEEKPICSLCESEVKNNDDFCPNCGSLFIDDIKCSVRENVKAKGVCVICCEPFCEECGIFVDRVFLCVEHSEYKFSEGMVNLFKTQDGTQMELIYDTMAQSGLHPLMFSERLSHNLSRILTNISPNESSRYELPTNGEQILMVPFQEVMRAEEILRDLELFD